jgi:hypothetical protein
MFQARWVYFDLVGLVQIFLRIQKLRLVWSLPLEDKLLMRMNQVPPAPAA